MAASATIRTAAAAMPLSSRILLRTSISRLRCPSSTVTRSMAIPALSAASSCEEAGRHQQHHQHRLRGGTWSASTVALATACITASASIALSPSAALAEQSPSTATVVSNDDEESNKDDDDETTKIINWSGTHSVTLPNSNYHEPQSPSELQTIVQNAYTSGQHIRPVGSALSPNGIAFDSRGMICLSHLDQMLDINKENMTVTVQAGARVSQVLDALRPHGLTLPNLASIAEQQVGGFVSVGAHGTGASIPPVDEFVVGLTMVTPSEHGVVHMTEQSHGPLFRLARLGLGGLGILSEVTLQVIPAHRLVEQTMVLSRSEAKAQLHTLLKRHKHVRYMWIPYEDAVVVVTNDPEMDLPLAMKGGTVVPNSGTTTGRKKIVTQEDVTPKYSKAEELAPMRELLHKLLKNKPASMEDVVLDDDTINGMGFGDLRDAILASGNMLDPTHIRQCNKAEVEFWTKAQGLDIAPSDQKLQFDCGGQQWVYEVCFPTGSYGLPNSNSMDFIEELLHEIETRGLPAPSPIEQRWTSSSSSPLSPAYVVSSSQNGGGRKQSYATQSALFSWVGIIMYLPSEDFDPTGYRREFIKQSFTEEYCKLVRHIGKKYGIMCHWAKLEVAPADDEDDDGVAESVRDHYGPKVISAYNAARVMYDPKGLLSCPLIDRIFGPVSSTSTE
jgi:L-galactono-1,4-lactone dehydrogenase